MKVLFVVNSIFAKGNGLSASARRTVRFLKEAGVDVRVLSAANPDPSGEQPDHPLREYRLPVIDFVIRKHGYAFAEVNKAVISQAVKWADIVHLEEPFDLEEAVLDEAEAQGVPVTATYHLHPENLFATICLERGLLLNGLTMRYWRKKVFDRCAIVQCPTENVKERLVKRGFKAELRVISNGITIEPGEAEKVGSSLSLSNAKYRIITIGRYSFEKDPMTVLRAMRYSAFARDTELILAGRGPIERRLKAYADKLLRRGIISYPVKFGFFALPDLQKLSKASDLYVHAATTEVEGLSCLEAIRVGLVPVIAKGPNTATSVFALSERSVFTQRDPKDLAAKIDYWLSHEAERKAEAEKYKGMDSLYDIRRSVSEMIKMFSDALSRYPQRDGRSE